MTRFLTLTFCLACGSSGPWKMQTSGTVERLRGIRVVSERVAWASGNHGTVLRTTDGGETWTVLPISGADSLDFRDIDATSEADAYVLSIGPGRSSRIYRTTDGGQHWQLEFQNEDPRAFYDAMAFWDSNGGIAMGDAVEGKLTVIRSTNVAWTPVLTMPDALEGEGGFAASGSCVATYGDSTVWLGSGVNCARVYRSDDRGNSWTVTPAPIYSASVSAGIFSLCKIDDRHGVAVGGDYLKPDMKTGTSVFTTDGGTSWVASARFPAGFRSCVVRIPGTNHIIAVGPNGSDLSSDFGQTWQPLDTTGFHAVDFASRGAGWAVGERGRIMRYHVSD